MKSNAVEPARKGGRISTLNVQIAATRHPKSSGLKTKPSACLVAVLLGFRLVGAQSNAPIPWEQIGPRGGADYQGGGLTVVGTGHGAAVSARLRCVFQRLEGEATSEGLWLTSTVTNTVNDRFRVMVGKIGRADRSIALPREGRVSVEGKLVRFIKPSLVEEYSVTMGGVRQDFVVLERPQGTGDLIVRLNVTGSKVKEAAFGAVLVLEKSGRKVAYSRLRVADATGRLLAAKMELVSESEIRHPKPEMTLAVLVDDSDAVYPVRVDPTFSDVNWISLGSIPGANGPIFATVVDNSGNLYIGGSFTIVGDVFATNIAKWNGNTWSALGSGMNSIVYALAVAGGDLYAGGGFTTAGANAANYIAKWNGSSWRSEDRR